MKISCEPHAECRCHAHCVCDDSRALFSVYCQEAQGAIHESRALRSKVQLAESAQRAARSMEHDYMEVVALLEAEIAQLKATKIKHTVSKNSVLRRPPIYGVCSSKLTGGCVLSLPEVVF